MNDWINKAVADLKIVLKFKSELKPGQSGVFTCPTCGGETLTVIRAECNGHIHAACKKDNCFRLME